MVSQGVSIPLLAVSAFHPEITNPSTSDLAMKEMRDIHEVNFAALPDLLLGSSPCLAVSVVMSFG